MTTTTDHPAQELFNLWQMIKDTYPNAVAASVTVLTDNKDGTRTFIVNTFPQVQK